MKTLKRLSKRAAEWCELSGYDPAKVRENMKSNSFAVERLETKKEVESNGADPRYPYRIFNPFNLNIKL
jgi:hypothetical protein